jgi:hypothetical protein
VLLTEAEVDEARGRGREVVFRAPGSWIPGLKSPQLPSSSGSSTASAASTIGA